MILLTGLFIKGGGMKPSWVQKQIYLNIRKRIFKYFPVTKPCVIYNVDKTQKMSFKTLKRK